MGELVFLEREEQSQTEKPPEVWTKSQFRSSWANRQVCWSIQNQVIKKRKRKKYISTKKNHTGQGKPSEQFQGLIAHFPFRSGPRVRPGAVPTLPPSALSLFCAGKIRMNESQGQPEDCGGWGGGAVPPTWLGLKWWRLLLAENRLALYFFFFQGTSWASLSIALYTESLTSHWVWGFSSSSSSYLWHSPPPPAPPPLTWLSLVKEKKKKKQPLKSFSQFWKLFTNDSFWRGPGCLQSTVRLCEILKGYWTYLLMRTMHA